MIIDVSLCDRARKPDRPRARGQGETGRGSLELDEQVLGVDLRAGRDMHGLHRGGAIGVDAGFHLHRLDRQQQVALRHLLPDRDGDRGDRSGHRRADMGGVAGLGLRPRLHRRFHRPVRHAHRARLAVQLEEHLHLAGLVGLAHRLIADLERLARVDLGRDLLARLHAIEEDRRRQGAHRPVLPVPAHVVEEDLRIHQIARQILVIDGIAVQLGRELCPRRLEIDRRQMQPRPLGRGGLALQRLLHDRLGPASGRLSKVALQHVDDRVGEGHVAVGIKHIGLRQPLRHHHQRHVAHHLRRRRDLHDVAEDLVRVGIGLRHRVPAFLKAKAARLRLEVGELAPRHLVQPDFRGGSARARFEGRILRAHRLPVVRHPPDRVDVEAGVALGMGERLDDRAEAGLRGAAREGVHRRVDGIDARLGRGQNRGPGDARGVMGVEVNGQAHLLLQRGDEGAGGGGLEQPRHVLQSEHMGARGLELLRHRDVILQVVFRPLGVQDVAGVADRALADLLGLDHRIHRDAHVLDPVQAVEDAEHVDAGLRRLRHEEPHHVVGIVGIAHPVRGAQQHLRQHVRHRRADVAQPLPGAFLQEAIGDVEGGAAPALDREQIAEIGRIDRRRGDHVDRAHPGRQERLVAVTHRGVGQQQPLLRLHPVGHRLRPFGLEQLPGAGTDRALDLGQARRACLGRRLRPARGLGMAVHRDVGDVGQDLGAAVAPLLELEELGRGVDELRRVAHAQESRVLEQVDDEVDVGAHAADAELAQRAVHAVDGLVGGLRPGGHLHQQAVVIAGDDAARIGGAAVEPDPHAGRGAIGGDAAVIGDEVVLRVLGRHPALQRMARERHFGLRGGARGLGECRALGNADLRLHDVDAGDLLGHGMLDLHARVDLDEVETALVHVHQELDGAGVLIADRIADLQRKAADLGALLGRQIGGRCALDHLLVAPLHGAVALEEVIEMAMRVAEQLHLDMAGAQDHLFQIALAIAEGGLGLAPALAHLLDQLLGAHDRAHAAPAAAPAGLQHQRIADRGRLGLDRVEIIAQHLGRRDHRHARLHRHMPGRGLVAKRAHGLGARADEGDAGLVAGFDEIGVFGQQPIARVDRVGARFLCDADDLGDREIGAHGAQPGADAVGLVRLETVQGELVFLGIDGDGLLAEFIGSPHHADGNLAPVGDQNLAEHHGPSPQWCRKT
ncbi:hypothetical protein SDC9_16859 [bioreactor metagenome]|uniref:Uncharacterized protein n=1 Tax=bioreactor metagenome TaxID=1076179 RepID=A0A644TZM5_9ZZZZ